MEEYTKNLEQNKKKSGSPARSGTVGFQIWQEKTKRGILNNLASLKKELWSVNFAKKSKKTPKNELRQAPSSKSQGRVAYFRVKKTQVCKYKKVTLSDTPLQQHCAVHRATAVPLPNAIALRPAAHCAAGVAHHRSGSAESITLSAGGAESMMLLARAESIILLAPPAESMMLSV